MEGGLPMKWGRSVGVMEYWGDLDRTLEAPGRLTHNPYCDAVEGFNDFFAEAATQVPLGKADGLATTHHNGAEFSGDGRFNNFLDCIDPYEYEITGYSLDVDSSIHQALSRFIHIWLKPVYVVLAPVLFTFSFIRPLGSKTGHSRWFEAMAEGDCQVTGAGQCTNAADAAHGFDRFIQGNQNFAGYRLARHDYGGDMFDFFRQFMGHAAQDQVL